MVLRIAKIEIKLKWLNNSGNFVECKATAKFRIYEKIIKNFGYK